jgi:hypothetical protein
MNNKTQEQMTDIIEDDKKENGKKNEILFFFHVLRFDVCIALTNTNPISFVNKTKVKLILPNTNNPDGITTVSVGVGQDTQVTNSIITDECVSSIKMNKSNKKEY